jgi:GNAT superfamily N-acetyltransferase
MAKKKNKEIKFRVGIARERGLFRKLWKEFLEEEYEKGKGNPITIMPTEKNLDTYCYLFDQYTSDAVPGFALFYREDAVHLCGYNGVGFETEKGDAKTAQSFGTYVRPAFRGKGISGLIYLKSEEICKQKDMPIIVGSVRSSNKESMSSVEKANWKVYGHILYKDLR